MKKILLLAIVLFVILSIGLFAFSKSKQSPNYNADELESVIKNDTDDQLDLTDLENDKTQEATQPANQVVDDSVKAIDEELKKLTDDNLNLDDF